MTRRARPWRAVVLALFTLHALPALADDRLVLVVGSGSTLSTLGALEVHKLYLGLPVVFNGQPLRALRNNADPLMRQVFYQSIVSMSETVYDRRMLALTLQRGRPPPPEVDDTRQLFDQLAQDPLAVGFAWAADAEKEPRVRVLRVLWHR